MAPRAGRIGGGPRRRLVVSFCFFEGDFYTRNKTIFVASNLSAIPNVVGVYKTIGSNPRFGKLLLDLREQLSLLGARVRHRTPPTNRLLLHACSRPLPNWFPMSDRNEIFNHFFLFFLSEPEEEFTGLYYRLVQHLTLFASSFIVCCQFFPPSTIYFLSLLLLVM